MADKYLLIDGYNLMHAAGMARERYGPGDLQRARERLLKFLFQRLTGSERAKTTLVFDARDAPQGLPHTWLRFGIHVVFAVPTGDADEVIEELLQHHAAPRQLTLVSSDHRLQNAARRRRAEFLDSDTFVDYLETRTPPQEAEPAEAEQTADPKLTGGASEAELAQWMAEFGDLSALEKERLPRRVAPLEPRAAEPGPLAGSQSVPQQDERPASPPAAKPHSAKPPNAKPPNAKPKPPPPSERPLFSDEWIDDLQHWADEQGKA
jgi:hypothetical protein